MPDATALFHMDAEAPYFCWSAFAFDGIRCIDDRSGSVTEVPAPSFDPGLLTWFDLWQSRLFLEAPEYFDLKALRYVRFADHAGQWTIAGPPGVAWVLQSSKRGVLYDASRGLEGWGGEVELLPWGAPPRIVARREEMGMVYYRDFGRLVALDPDQLVYSTVRGIRSVSLGAGTDEKLDDNIPWPNIATARGRVYYAVEDRVVSQLSSGGDRRTHARLDGPATVLTASSKWLAAFVQPPARTGKIVVIGAQDAVIELLELPLRRFYSTHSARPLLLDGDRLYVVTRVGHTPAVLRVHLPPVPREERCPAPPVRAKMNRASPR